MIIGLSGYAQSGKDTAANYLIQQFGFKRLSFADPIKEFLKAINPILEDGHRLNELIHKFGWDLIKNRTEVRRLLQETGMTARKMFGKDFWIEQALLDTDPLQRYVVSDVRFINEADYIRDLGGTIWRINRIDNKPINAHISEIAMDDYSFDFVLQNDGLVEDLHLQIRTRMMSLV